MRLERGSGDEASRRTFLKNGLGACAAGVLVAPISGQPAAVPVYKAVFDERFEEARAFAAGATERGIRTAAIRGDVTKLFFEDLDLQWRQGPVVLAGYTTSAPLFCLDLLARDRGMRAIHRAVTPGVKAALGVLDGAPLRVKMARSGDPSALVFWVIAPKAELRLG